MFIVIVTGQVLFKSERKTDMKAPDKIYIAETPNKLIEIWSDEPIEPKPYITEHEYIRKDALLKWLVQRNKEINGETKALWRSLEIKELYDKIDSL